MGLQIIYQLIVCELLETTKSCNMFIPSQESAARTLQVIVGVWPRSPSFAEFISALLLTCMTN